MTEVRWTPQGARRSPGNLRFRWTRLAFYAQVIVEEILAAVDRLERFPLMGRHVPERPRNDLRELIKPPYRIVYQVDEVVRILTIFRASRLFPSSLE